MATDKTPDYKRIQRAEAGREEWKIKATLRREESEKLAMVLKAKEARLKDVISEKQNLQDQLEAASKKIAQQEKLIENLKKKRPK